MTIRNIVRGNANTYFRNIARNYKIFADNGNRMAFMAPFQEMNGDWVPYASPDPNDYITAFHIIRNIFIEEGVPEQSVRWVFAPNGSSTSGYPGFEAYYPGSAYVDVIAFSAYHFGYCDWAPPSWRGWLTPQVAIGTYLERALAIDPGKPVFIAQTATSSETRQGPNHAAKDAWLSEAYNYFLRGRDDYEKFFYSDAQKFLQKAVELDPTFAVAYLYLDRAIGELRDYKARDEAYEVGFILETPGALAKAGGHLRRALRGAGPSGPCCKNAAQNHVRVR